MLLKMFIGDWFITDTLVDFTGFTSPLDRQLHVEKLANDIYWREVAKWKVVGAKATFFLDNVQSKMNDL